MTEEEIKRILSESARLERFVREAAKRLYDGPHAGPHDDIDVKFELRRGRDGKGAFFLYWDGPEIRGESIGVQFMMIPLADLTTEEPPDPTTQERVWKPLDVNSLRLYKVLFDFFDNPAWNMVKIVAAESPTHAANLIRKLYADTKWKEEPTIRGRELNIWQPREWTE